MAKESGTALLKTAGAREADEPDAANNLIPGQLSTGNAVGILKSKRRQWLKYANKLPASRSIWDSEPR